MAYVSEAEKAEMLPHQQRVAEEHEALSEKIEKLESFIGEGAGSIWLGLPYDEQGRLKIQLFIMKQYKAVLEDRIDNFPL